MALFDDSTTLTPSELDRIEIVVTGTIAGEGENLRTVKQVYHFGLNTFNGTYDPADIVAQFKSAVQDSITPRLHSDYTLRGISVVPIANPVNLPYEVTYSEAGGRAGDRLPSDQCVTVQLRSANRGRSYQGKKFYAPIAETVTTADLLSADTAGWGTVRSVLSGNPAFTDTSGNAWLPLVLSRTLSQLQVLPVVITSAVITSAKVNLTLGNVRKRKAKPQLYLP